MKRLLDDPRCAGELRADLLRSRSAGQDYQTAAKLLQLRAAFSDNPPAARAAADHGLNSALKRVAHPGWKLAVLAALGGGAGLLAYATQPAASVPQLTAAEPMPPAAVELPPAAQPPQPEVAAPVPEVAPPPAAPAPASRRAAETNSSRREIAQLVRMRALLERDPAAAYRLAQRAEREFPRGILAEERQALSIVALCRSGAHERARQRARMFFARYPQSPLRETVEAALQH